MAARGNEEDDFGISVPPLVEYLRGILREYSDGQIIKELVQNAEDAGADTVKFLYDVKQHGTDTLYKPTLAPYQGPALYSFNNAKFKEVDWNGIQNIARSNKKTNCLKVGRFGIGFNSVYHITDLPSIMSDQTLAFIDPLEEHFFDQRGRVKTGKRFVLGSNSETFSTCKDQFSPYDNIFPGVTGGISTGHCDGTLFRFPLRLTANELSDKTYNDENRMDELLQAFQVDADVVMLFLRSLNNVEVLKRHSGQQEPSLVVRVRREHDQDGNPQERDFSSRLESYCSDESGSRRPIEMTDCVTYTTETQETSKTHRWIVSHLIAGDSISGELSILAEKQSHLPWAAIAIPISSSEPYHAVDEAESLGRVFCFLPLPPGEESLTGLPVHVHGFFGVNSDRRGIKWPGPDQTDTPAQWNKLLVSELIPIAYVNAIRYAISLHMSQQNVSTDSIYQSWPDHEVVRGNWDILLEPFYNALFKKVVIHSDNKGWMKVADVFFNELAVRKEMEEAILKCFSMSGIAYAKVPPNCRQAIERFYQPQVSKISVSSLCRYLREDHSILTKLNREEKLLILEFILQEDAGEDLEGLPLLPVDDGSFEVFSSSGRKVYIPTCKFCRKLVPGGHQQFIISEEHSLHQLLSVMGGRYQLNSLTIDAVAELLRATMETWVDDQGSWLLQDISLPTWLKEVWSMLYRESSSKLHLFEGICLVPLFEAGDDDRRLLQLCPRSRVIQRRHQTSEGPVTLPNGLENVLQQIGVMVTNCPDYVLCHPAIRDEYIKMPTPEGVVTCLLLSDVELLIQKFLSFSSLDRDVLVESLAQAKLSPDGKSLLRHLPLFERVAGTGSSTGTLVCINECREYIECCQTDIPAPLKLTGLLIDGRAKSKSLLQKLEAIQLSKYQVILTVLEEIRGGQLYTISEKQLVLQWIMERWGDVSINCKSSVDILRHMKFIHNKDASVLSPSELLDPLDPLLQRLFESQGVFPVAPFASAQVVAALKQLGMRGQSEVTPAELVKCIEQIEESKSQEKARSLLHLLTKNQGLLQSSVAECMKQKQCIPCKLSPPEYYPSAMEWFGNSPVLLSTPREIMRETKKDVLICGASKRFTSKEDESRFSAVYQNIGMTSSSPTLLDVIAQFTHCVRYAEDRTGEDITDIVPMLKEIYSFLREAWRSDSNVKDVLMNQAKFCIWNGSGFSEPSKMCTGKLPFDLSPYIASIPPAISEFTDLFEALGVEKNMETNADALVQILHEVKRRCDDSEADTAFLQRQRQLVMQILHHIHAVGDLAEEARGQLLVPSHRGECRLIPVEQSAYVDRDWLRQSSENEEMDDGEDFTLIHSDISMDLAKFLHVRPVSRLLLDSEELEGFIQAGQHEPLTMRLWNILKNNYEDTAIVNEMIQNAEDAGAEEVRFLIDLRKNENASKKLFNPGMKSCQGQALWVYNDAVFTDQDFENILHLGGRTKEKNTEKIGKFGTGFNSVYRITDVPSFVSREYVQFFDPHTTHLGNVLPNKSQPGVRLKLNSMKQLRRFPDQFKPFNGVFGLDFSRGNTSFQYPGTLFRLPLRSKEAAQKSQICKESYDEEKLISLMRQMWESSQDLLVFTKKVKKVSLFYLNENSIDPSAAEELFIIQKDIQPSRIREDDTVISTESYHRRVTAKGVEVLLQVRGIGNLERTATFDTLKVVCKTSKQASAVAQSEEGKSHGLSPEGAVAIPMKKAGPQTIKAKIFCGLPLSVFSYLPIHIDGRFAINEDRRSLQSPTPHGMTISERWNHVVFSDVVCRAYLSLLSDREFIRQVKKTYGRDISPELFWPDVDEVSENSECSALFDAFYRAIVNGLDGKEPAVFWRDDTPLQFHNVVFLGRYLQKKKEIKDDCMKVLRTYMKEHCCTSTEVIELSEKTWQAFERVGVTGKVEMRTYTLNRFFDDVFLPYLEQVPRDLRDRLLLFVINATEGNLNQKLKDVKCIPVAGESELKRPRELMHSDDQILRELFELQGVFPTAPFDSGHLIPAFKRLGMRGQNEVTPDEIATCVDLIETSPCPTKARVLLQLLNKNPGHFQRTLPNGCTVADFMRKKRCIPCRKSPPEYYPLDLEWHGRTSSCLATPQEILIETRPAALISGTSKSFISQQDHPFSTALTELGITCNTPVLPDVIAQLESCVRYATDRAEQDVTDIITMLKEIYRFLREAWKRDSNVSSHILNRVRLCVWNGNGFSEPSKMCTGKLPFDLAPYMSSIPHATSAFQDLFEGLGVKANIDTNSDALVEILHDIKSRCDEPGTSVSFQQTQRQLVLQILHLIHAVGELTEEARERLLVPSHRDECCLIPVEQSAYVDRDWLRQSSENEEIDDGEDFTLIHSDISMDLAVFLHVRPVSRLLLDSEELQGLTQAGQHEPLTMRLWNILKNNYEDTAIVNEMIQNAEDAGAEEVRFLIDLRKNENASKKLFDPGMKSCQGPALWVYNDAVFTDQDFENILRLGGRTKEKNTEKIGKFGTGFNSVYRITDVPSFVSREYVQFFDPHTTHLGNVLPNKSQPGVRVKLNSTKQLRRFPDQFKPFNGVFGLDFSGGNASFHYPGTLFRLPLRSKEAAQKSQICKESYDEKKLIGLMQQMWESSLDLLVFTRKVKKVSVFCLGEHSIHPAEAEELFTIMKKVHLTGVKDDEIVTLTESFRRTMTTKGHYMISGTPECDVTFHLDTFKVICKTSTEAASLSRSPEGKECGLSPEGAVAFPFHVPPISAFEKKVYCFLPLSITSKFPVHINGSFAVKEDRRSLHMPVPNGRFIHEKWNHILLADVISRAYVSLLSDNEFIQELKRKYGCDVSPESLWPDIDDVPKNSEWSALFDAFYKAMIHGLDGHLPSLFWKDGRSHQFTHVVFLGEGVQKEKSVCDVVTEVLQDHLKPLEVISLSEKTWKALERVGLRNEVITRTYDFNRFFDEVFLPQISEVPEDMRNQLVLFALNSREGELKGKLKDVDCIPVAGGIELRKPGDLVHPKGEAAPLYSESDKVFPLGEKFNSADTLSSLCELGMTRDFLDEHAFLKRCETVHILHSNNQEMAQNRCYAVLRYLSESLFKRRWQKEEDLKEKLKTIPFLPILREHNQDPALPWLETNDSCAYTSADNVYSHSKRYLVSSKSNVVDKTQEWHLPRNVEYFLGLATKYPSVQEVLKQFSNFRTHFDMRNESISNRQLEEICEELYKYIESACKENCLDIIIKELQSQPFFLVDRKFVVGTMIAEEGPDLPPYLLKASPFLKRFPYLRQHAAWKKTFDSKDYQGVLQSIYEKSSGQPLDNEGLEVAVFAADRLTGFVSDDTNQQLDAFLPDEHNRMMPVSELCYCDVDWFEFDEFELLRCSKKISFMVARKLKVKDIRQQMLGSYDMTFPGEAFGQHEKLTTRITRILESYPSDETILKELLQNADDAGASEIHFVYDPRSHHGNKLLGDRMEAMQGPALCVFNNQSFTDEDIRGIQNLGEGSKADNMGKIGRYGVGFNAVYQLTDCPSFISKGERLCMFDPLLKYVPGATPNKPGRQIKVDKSVRSSYPDVFPCYLEDKLAYGRKDFTVFRFPLRMEASQLSQNAWPADKIRKLLQDFERAAFESLLFLKNISKISVSEITSSGDIEGTRTICGEVSEIDKEKKGNFLREVQKFVTSTQSDGNFQPEPAEAIYQMKLKGKGREEEWVICQQVGSEDVAVKNAMQKYKLLPVGAVAARLPGRKGEFQGKAFCFLPLPIETGLPVHVHGYFALDHESRRHLWEGSTTDEQTKWNFHIIQRVIAPAYVRLLLRIQEFFVTKYEWSGLISHEQTGHTLKFLQKYHTYFPMVSDKGSYWKALADRLYEIVTSEALKVFPSVYREHDDHKDYFLKWKTPIESPSESLESEVGYFNTLPNQMDDQYVPPSSFPMHREKQEIIKKLKETLIEITFPLLESPPWIMKRLRDACKQLGDETSRPHVLEVSPSNVISFLHRDNPLQTQLPITLSKSRIHDEEGLRRLISYCKKVREPSFKEHLHGLPLLLTGDDKLRRFSRDERVFHSKFCNLFTFQSHKFLHDRFLHSLPVEADVFCELDVTEVSSLLRDCTPSLECGSDEIKPLSNYPSPEWFGRLWRLLASFCNETKKPLDIATHIRAKLGCWAILPVTQSQPESRPCQNQTIEQVAPIRLSPTTIMEPAYRYNWSIYSVLESLNVYKVDNSILLEDNHKLIQHLVAHKDEPTRALDVFMYWVDKDPERFTNLDPDEHEEILRSFISLELSPAQLEKLKSLPCFKTIGGDFVSIRGYNKVLVLPSMIPTTEQAVWIKTTRAVFLQYNSSLTNLYKKLGLGNTTEIDVYAKYIIPAFNLLSEGSRLKHLARVKQLLHLLPWDESRSPEECRKDAIRRLGLCQVPFITGDHGEVMKAADFYDPQNKIFFLMLSEDHFPPERVQISLGLDFLREIGLQVHVTKDLFLSFAKQVHKSHPNPSEMRNKSHALVLELRQNCELHEDSDFLQRVSEIDFLVSDEISKEMKSIHPPFMKAGTLMRYSGSTSFKHKQLVWSTNSILPGYASISGKCWSCETILDGKMGVAPEPELMGVIKHLRNMCNRIQQKNDKKIPFPEELVTVLQAILTFLSSKCVGQSCHEDPCERCCIIRDELRNVPIVFLELKDEHRLVKAEQVCRTMEENFETFICQLPDKWVPFFKVFQMLGGTVRPSIGQYAFVLQSIYDRGQDATINPNVINMVDRATRGLYGELIKIDSPLDTAAFAPAQSLYLPSSMGTLKRSDQLLINDFDHYANRLSRSNLPLVKVFPSHERIAREAISKLPAKMKPKAVSKEVREELRTGKECFLNGVEPCEFGRRLQILQSGEFLNALCCIMKHNGKKVDEETKNRFKGQLSCLKITCMHQLHSVLQIHGEDVAGSETEVPSFISSDNELFVRHSDEENTMETLLSVAIHVNQVLGNVLEDRNYMSILLSQKSPRTISHVLEMFSIPGELTEEDTSFKLPDPGSTIPEQLYHLIEQDPWTSFHEGDYVAYAQTDEDGEYYIYAVVVKTIGSESLKSFHLIDVGRGSPIEANVLDIHKIHIPKSTIGMELVPSDKVNSGEGEPFRAGHRESSLPTEIEEAKQQVTTELEEVWQLPEEQKRKALRRLMLKWHPDKHPEGPKELFDEAFKHLQKEIHRLEKGLSRTSSWFEDLFKSTNQRAREDRQRYTHFGGFSSGFWRGGGFSGGGFRSGTRYNTFHQFFSDVSRAPDIRNARRWLRQGQEDLRASQHDLDPHDEPSLEWVAYKCHQSVEKALKASQLAIRGQYSYTHFIGFLANNVSDHFNKSEFLQNVYKLGSLVDDQQARYPDRCAFSEIPHEVFRDKAKAEEMIKLAHSILEEVQTFVH